MYLKVLSTYEIKQPKLHFHGVKKDKQKHYISSLEKNTRERERERGYYNTKVTNTKIYPLQSTQYSLLLHTFATNP